MGDLVYVPLRIVLKCAHACSRAEVVDNAFVEGTGGSRALMYFHSANRVRGHMSYLPRNFSDCEAAAYLKVRWFAARYRCASGAKPCAPEMCQLADRGHSDDAERAVRKGWVGGARGQARSVFVAHGVERAQSVLGAVRFYFQVVSDCLAFRPVAQDHFVIGVFELEAPQHGEW